MNTLHVNRAPIKKRDIVKFGIISIILHVGYGRLLTHRWLFLFS